MTYPHSLQLPDFTGFEKVFFNVRRRQPSPKHFLRLCRTIRANHFRCGISNVSDANCVLRSLECSDCMADGIFPRHGLRVERVIDVEDSAIYISDAPQLWVHLAEYSFGPAKITASGWVLGAQTSVGN